MKRPLVLIGFNVIVILFLSFVQVVVANSISTTGIELEKMQKEIAVLKKKNALLHEDVLVASSLTQISSKAAELGFTEEKSPFVLSSPLPLARR